ncbi:hypothetical protein BESB_026700 [Besnoitia besnoiti]|uniref:Uncharacterized protein n=1 Tax=Besnoitia besnoiti TaxID=94643 RepID=A0A2A9M729_BESBE|nr:uncharacterized protein BESB_026700 [Besnoitia besnoiti]PFH31696.1 hypothetical protein BESB_026700 [Besnoitia besnoiti]
MPGASYLSGLLLPAATEAWDIISAEIFFLVSEYVPALPPQDALPPGPFAPCAHLKALTKLVFKDSEAWTCAFFGAAEESRMTTPLACASYLPSASLGSPPREDLEPRHCCPSELPQTSEEQEPPQPAPGGFSVLSSFLTCFSLVKQVVAAKLREARTRACARAAALFAEFVDNPTAADHGETLLHGMPRLARTVQQVLEATPVSPAIGRLLEELHLSWGSWLSGRNETATQDEASAPAERRAEGARQGECRQHTGDTREVEEACSEQGSTMRERLPETYERAQVMPFSQEFLALEA